MHFSFQPRDYQSDGSQRYLILPILMENLFSCILFRIFYLSTNLVLNAENPVLPKTHYLYPRWVGNWGHHVTHRVYLLPYNIASPDYC